MSSPTPFPASTQPHLPGPELADPQMRKYRWEVGDTVTYIVGVEGVLSHKSADSVTIAGIALPRRMGPTDVPDSGPGVRYLSMVWPEECDGNCGSGADDADDEFDSSLGEAYAEEQYQEGSASANRAWSVLVATEHEADTNGLHDGPFRFCSHPLCAHANLADRGL